ncbi:Dot/Icm T4SS effector AnkK/LegA5 [Legionella quateirensis]|uniref:Cardiac ankyrin repeat-containing protein K n=1 Tax=Legionella quateirensis TaxID=45072 RepID=A0A378L4G1_9GAMM|nr:Dot/Icm T4SS effector AnkK/LegA5 [Legionella quateirensis]KTD46211.1 putative Cardiac ankyrin repeat-containing protein K [Legionella quateirensis]STY19020.1 substrate of the Dot/Icm secretion system [Legionella quateirensis]
MPSPYLFNNIDGLNDHSGSQLTGHITHDLKYQLEDGTLVPIIYKENKHHKPEASIKEVAFSEMARLFMLPHSTPMYHLVHDEEQDKITGVACLHIHLSIAQQVKIKNTAFQKINYSSEKKQYVFDNVKVKNSADIPYQFLNQLPHGFFSAIMEQRAQGALTIDMDSLASTFVNKYTLEEDDLHKGNFGIYTIIKNNKPHIVFFNIDHDLMLSDSIMSFIDLRATNWSYGEKSFNISPRDLRNFPDLRDSGNHYWPTQDRFAVKFNDDRVYTNANERNAFISLKNDPEFNHYKWKRFLKCMMVPEQLMKSAMALHLDPSNPRDASEINLITQATHERIIKLRAVLLSIPEFRAYLNSELGKNDLHAIKQEFNQYMAESLINQQSLIPSIQKDIESQSDHYLKLSSSESETLIKEGDNPLHVTIRLGEYRFDESQKAFSDYLHTANSDGQLPIEAAADMAQSYEVGSEKINPGKDPFCVIRHLLAQGAKMTPKVAEVIESKGVDIENYRFHSQYYDRKIENYADLKDVMGEISKDHDLSLKNKKIFAVNVIRQHIHSFSSEEIKQLKKDLNGTKNNPIASEFLFISQLRSSLWIVRAIRGLYGNSSTKMELNSLINDSEYRLKVNPHQLFVQRYSSTITENRPEVVDDNDSKKNNRI